MEIIRFRLKDSGYDHLLKVYVEAEKKFESGRFSDYIVDARSVNAEIIRIIFDVATEVYGEKFMYSDGVKLFYIRKFFDPEDIFTNSIDRSMFLVKKIGNLHAHKDPKIYADGYDVFKDADYVHQQTQRIILWFLDNDDDIRRISKEYSEKYPDYYKDVKKQTDAKFGNETTKEPTNSNEDDKWWQIAISGMMAVAIFVMGVVTGKKMQ